jgi:hypothetical protein
MTLMTIFHIEENTMHELQKKGMEQSIKFLDSINCQYKVIDPDGNVYTNIVESTKKRKTKQFPLGAVKAYYMPFIENIQVGEVVCIPYGNFPSKTLASSVTSQMSAMFGKKSYTSHRTEAGLEVMRLF